MSDLDKKLREILPIVATGMEIDQDLAIKINYAPERIKQAFKDSGWVEPITDEERETMIASYAAAEYVKSETMNGQEWFDRFIKELPPVGSDAVTVCGDKPKNWVVSWDDVERAAKKAAGLDKD